MPRPFETTTKDERQVPPGGAFSLEKSAFVLDVEVMKTRPNWTLLNLGW